MNLPDKVNICEVGPREGFQIEKRVIPTADKVRLIEALAKTGLPEIEVTSFVRGDRVPQMADAEQLVQDLREVPGVTYTGMYLNQQGLERALKFDKLKLDYKLSISASETFSKKNTNVTHSERLQYLNKLAENFRNMQVSTVGLGISAAFGCNFEGTVPQDKVLDLLHQIYQIAQNHKFDISIIWLMDTMGWANPLQVTRMVAAIREDWPDTPIGLHLHDTRGLGIANAYAGLCMGVTNFDASIGGLGGCPFGGHRGAAGNIATEDFVFLCHELGIGTGINLDALLDCVTLAEEIVGRPLIGKVKNAGNLACYR